MEQSNLLANGEFEGDFHAHRNDDRLLVAAGWAPWWKSAAEDDPPWKNQKPHYSPASVDDKPSQQVSTPFGTHVAGLWQQIPAAPGNRYELSVMGQAWSSEDDSPGSRRDASDVNLQVGVDPTGGLDPESPLVQWGNTAQPLSRWETLRLSFDAEANIVTVYLRSAPPLPKRQQTVFWRNAVLLPDGRYKRNVSIVGAGDTHLTLEPDYPIPEQEVAVLASSMRNHPFVQLQVRRPDGKFAANLFKGSNQEDDRTLWRYTFTPDHEGLYDIRFVSDEGARLLAQRLVRVSHQTQLVPSGEPRQNYRRVYVLLPPTATEKWIVAAARGSYTGRFTVGFSADDAGVGDLEERFVLAVNPHHWPGILTATWFKQHYPGVHFLPVVANSPEDLESWLKDWMAEE
ncbi:MAG TPA: hypothetical protein VE553_06915 [Candidatus Binatia bacterium]|jgi:hypothetical protein|nr:hypothetical protein [Candidatus Binatia bacterium]